MTSAEEDGIKKKSKRGTAGEKRCHGGMKQKERERLTQVNLYDDTFVGGALTVRIACFIYDADLCKQYLK